MPNSDAQRLKVKSQRFGTLCLFHLHRRVGMNETTDAGESPRRKHATFRTWRKFEIKEKRIKLTCEFISAFFLVQQKAMSDLTEHWIHQS
jgi:hypothetical protein